MKNAVHSVSLHLPSFHGYDPVTLFQAIGLGQISKNDAASFAEDAIRNAALPEAWNFPVAFLAYLNGEFAKSLQLLKLVSHIFAEHTDWFVLAGMCAKQLDDLPEAEAFYKRALELSPNRSDIYYNYGNLLKDGDPATAEQLYRKSLSIDVNVATVWHNLGIALNRQNHSTDALIPLKFSLLLDPDIADAWCNLGLAYYALDSFSCAEACFRYSISLDQGHAPSHLNLGNVLMSTFKPEDAIKYLERGVQLEVSSTNSLFNLGLAYLSTGSFEKGWEYYEARFSTKDFSDKQIPTSGVRLRSLDELFALQDTAQEIVVWAEQGMGDSIQFCRYLPLLNALGIPFTFYTRKPLLELHRDWSILGQSVRLLETSNPAHDNRPHIPLMSLPHIFRTKLETIPSSVPYLVGPQSTPPHLKINPPDGGLAIGIAWASNPDNKAMYKNKSIPASMLIPPVAKLVSLGLAHLHSLQFGEDTAQFAPWRDTRGMYEWHDQSTNYADTAFLVRQLDLVITVDTAVAHLAGALNRPTWLLLPANCDFRWLRNTDKSPWYPSVRLFRQSCHGDWSSVIRELAEALNILLLMDLPGLVNSRSSENTHQ